MHNVEIILNWLPKPFLHTYRKKFRMMKIPKPVLFGITIIIKKKRFQERYGISWNERCLKRNHVQSPGKTYRLKKLTFLICLRKLLERQYLLEITWIFESQSWYLNPGLCFIVYNLSISGYCPMFALRPLLK